MIKVMTVFGTRPEAIKMAPLILELKKRKEIECIVCVTAQHREMLDQVLDIFKITPNYDFNIMKSGQSLSDITTRVLSELNRILQIEKPNIILVHGDTTTTFSAALAAFYNQIDIGHVEAGLRTYCKYSPYPEEMNRQMVGNIADLHFAPTELSKQNLLSEQKDENQIYVTGNTAIDAMSYTVKDNYQHEVLDWVGTNKLVLLTAHRRENLGKPMYEIFNAVKRVMKRYPDVRVVYPIHMNPKIREIAQEVFKDDQNIRIIEPLDVIDFHNFQKKSFLILTDSGGVQEEAPSLGKPVLVLRDTTERPEGVSAGTLKLVGTDQETIFKNVCELLDHSDLYQKMSNAMNPYGDGNASKRITDIIIKKYDKLEERGEINVKE